MELAVSTQYGFEDYHIVNEQQQMKKQTRNPGIPQIFTITG
jgi:hypothetical protein